MEAGTTKEKNKRCLSRDGGTLRPLSMTQFVNFLQPIWFPFVRASQWVEDVMDGRHLAHVLKARVTVSQYRSSESSVQFTGGMSYSAVNRWSLLGVSPLWKDM